jgi:predicted GIY-YIG superfamily endonuclease
MIALTVTVSTYVGITVNWQTRVPPHNSLLSVANFFSRVRISSVCWTREMYTESSAGKNKVKIKNGLVQQAGTNRKSATERLLAIF